MKTTLATILIGLALCMAASAKDKGSFPGRAAKDGELNHFFYNFIAPNPDDPLAVGDVWTMVCVQEPCVLFHSGDSLTLAKEKVQRVHGFKQRLTYEVCSLTLGTCNREAVIAMSMTHEEYNRAVDSKICALHPEDDATHAAARKSYCDGLTK